MATYLFHSSKERIFKTYNDCPSCKPYEYGDTDLWRQFVSKKVASEIFKGYDDNDSTWEYVRDSFSTIKEGKRKIVGLKSKEGKSSRARILWIKPSQRTWEYWVIQAPNVEIAKEFENSQAFKKIKESIPKNPPSCDSYGSNSSNYDWCK